MKLNIGIVVQGKYVPKYTKNVVEYYLQNCPSYFICLSCWVGDKEIVAAELNYLRNEKRLLIEFSEYPKFSGYQNINYQIVSTLNGLVRLKEAGCNWAIKSRTDFMLIDIGAFEKHLVQQNGRICGLETDDVRYNLFFVSDFLLSGNLEELILYFSCPLQYAGNNREAGCAKLQQALENRDVYMRLEDSRIAERYLVSYYLKRKGYYLPQGLLEKLYLWPLLARENFYLINRDDIRFSSLKRYASLEKRSSTHFYSLEIMDDKNMIRYVVGVMARYVVMLLKRFRLSCSFTAKIFTNYFKN
ncbi:hypothetical protein ACFO5Q_16760 [Kordiimonas lipolytica]|uniref:WavE lipopolysaccharide synthesis n=1 Tax=Kordiimonas lipolytica TaxID=1662421 RepID=A0ABV8UE21_9PROT|nr:hypothetical protein [Kordiimonas lipolytica]